MSAAIDRIFSPQTIAVIGATQRPGSVGRMVMRNLSPFKGRVYPVNPNHPSIFHHKAYPNIRSVPEPIDLAVIVTPAKTVPQIVAECVDANVAAAIIISAGFKETGVEGLELEEQILFSSRGHMRIIGPNCLGVMRPSTHLNATFAHGMAVEGNTAFLSQSGALCTAALDWSMREKVGFSAVVSIGSMIDVDWGDLLEYFGRDPLTKNIMIYMESVGQPEAFCSAARRITQFKPIILLKVGRSHEAAKAAISHTGALVEDDEVFTAAMQRIGVMRVEKIAELFFMAQTLAKQPMPKGHHLTIVTNAGGPGVIATDALMSYGGGLTLLGESALSALDTLLPPHWSHHNPVDVLGDATAQRFEKAIEIAGSDPNTDAILAILTPQAVTEPTQTAEKLCALSHADLPIFASWMGARSVEEGKDLLRQSKVPVFEYPEDACDVFVRMCKHVSNLRDIGDDIHIQTKPTNAIIEAARKEQRSVLDEVESKKILEAHGIPIVVTEIARDEKSAVKIAEKIGFPVCLKIYSRAITHKSEAGGVKLNLKDADAVVRAFREIQSIERSGATVQPMIDLDGYELIAGSMFDEQFGPVIVFGAGGHLVEVVRDRALAIPPLNRPLAHRLIGQTKIYHALQGMRGCKKIDIARLEGVLIQLSYLILQQPWIKECDINPLFVSDRTLLALDARIILHDQY